MKIEKKILWAISLSVKSKAGQKGKPTVSLRYTYGVEQQPQRIPLLNARDYITLSRSNIAKFNQADLTYNGKEDQAKFLILKNVVNQLPAIMDKTTKFEAGLELIK